MIKIGGTSLTASRIGLGTSAMGGWRWGGSVSGAIQTIQAALDRGVTLIDTAPVYGFGRAEEIVGTALAWGERRDRALIATKVGLEWINGKVHRNSTPERMRRELEGSLRRLKTDRIDLYQVHWPDPLVPIEDTAAVLGKFLTEGKIRAIGVSNFSLAQIEAFRKVAPIHAVQPPYNLFERAIEASVLPYAKQNGITVLAYCALCRGLLTGRISATTRFEGDDLRKVDPKFREPRRHQYLAAVRALERFARERYGRSVLALALRWILDQGGTIALWGARRPEQIEPLDEVAGWVLDAAAMQEIDRILNANIKSPIGPEFMAPPARSGVRPAA